MGKMQRTKGASFERETAVAFQRVYPQARRGLGQARAAGEVPDVDKTPWWCECKRGSKGNLVAALKQAREASDGRPPLAVLKRDGTSRAPEQAVVALYQDDFLDLVAELELLRARDRSEPDGES